MGWGGSALAARAKDEEGKGGGEYLFRDHELGVIDAGVGGVAAGIEGYVEEADGYAAEERAKGLRTQSEANNGEKVQIAFVLVPAPLFLRQGDGVVHLSKRAEEGEHGGVGV